MQDLDTAKELDMRLADNFSMAVKEARALSARFVAIIVLDHGLQAFHT
jgi:hypothetical protein